MTKTTETPPFNDTGETIDEAMAFIHHEGGDEALAEMLKMMISGISANHPYRASLPKDVLDEIEHGDLAARKELEDVTKLWREMGLPGVSMVAEAAATIPPKGNPFDPKTDLANWRDWHRRRHGAFPDE